MTRLTIEIETEIKNDFTKKAREEGYTAKGIILKWIKKYLTAKKD